MVACAAQNAGPTLERQGTAPQHLSTKRS
jgi:hypothetical protein